MKTVTVRIGHGVIVVTSPYDGAFVRNAREINGKWNGEEWIFDARDEQRVLGLLRDVYGTDGIMDADEPTVTVRVPLTNRYVRQELRVAGLSLVRRPNRDEAVRYGDDVVLVDGGFPSGGGSRQFPDLDPYPGTVVEVRDLPRLAAEKILRDVPGAYVVGEVAELRERLEREKGELTARLTEIDEALKALA